MNGLAKGGIITSFVGAGFGALIGLIMVISSGILTSVLPSFGGIATVFSILILVTSVLTIVFGSLALAKKNNTFKILCGILALVSVVFNWMAFFFPAIISVVGGILTLCGKTN